MRALGLALTAVGTFFVRRWVFLDIYDFEQGILSEDKIHRSLGPFSSLLVSGGLYLVIFGVRALGNSEAGPLEAIPKKRRMLLVTALVPYIFLKLWMMNRLGKL